MKTFEQKVQDAFDEACFPPQYYQNGIVPAVHSRVMDAFEEELEKLQNPNGVYVSMLAGKIAKLNFRLWAHSHGINDNALIAKVQKILGSHLDKK